MNSFLNCRPTRIAPHLYQDKNSTLISPFNIFFVLDSYFFTNVNRFAFVRYDLWVVKFESNERSTYHSDVEISKWSVAV